MNVCVKPGTAVYAFPKGGTSGYCCPQNGDYSQYESLTFD